MDSSTNICRVRRIGLATSGIALVAFLLALLTGNQNLGFRKVISRVHQRDLLLIAGVLFVAHLVSYFSNRKTISHSEGRDSER
jgi:hypothetical protein